MSKGRMEAFSDGVIAILITIMVLELKVPQGAGLTALRPLVPVFLSYVLSFVFLGIYWNNHHHLLQAIQHVDGRVLWANLHLLFWLSLIPFATGWSGENQFAAWPVALYGTVLLLAAVAYFTLTRPCCRFTVASPCWQPLWAASSRAGFQSSFIWPPSRLLSWPPGCPTGCTSWWR